MDELAKAEEDDEGIEDWEKVGLEEGEEV